MVTGKLAKLIVLFVAGLLVMGFSASAATNSMPVLPGINAPDAYPKGCVDCHNATGGKDFRLIKVLEKIKGGHPDVAKLVKNVPMDCLKCHYASALAPVLGSMVHRNHYSNLTNNDFLVNDKGSCLSCHTVDTQYGKIAVKNAAANW